MRHLQKKQVYAVIRVETDAGSNVPLVNKITVTKILLTRDHAEKEAQRLNDLNGPKGCVYFWQATRLLDCPNGTVNT